VHAALPTVILAEMAPMASPHRLLRQTPLFLVNFQPFCRSASIQGNDSG
jgi:hypothetical protein